jgi:hypothetical protein
MMSQVETRVSAAPATLEWWAILLIVLGSIAVGIPMLLIPGGIIVAIIGGAITGLVFLLIPATWVTDLAPFHKCTSKTINNVYWSVTTENIRFKHQHGSTRNSKKGLILYLIMIKLQIGGALFSISHVLQQTTYSSLLLFLCYHLSLILYLSLSQNSLIFSLSAADALISESIWWRQPMRCKLSLNCTQQSFFGRQRTFYSDQWFETDEF